MVAAACGVDGKLWWSQFTETASSDAFLLLISVARLLTGGTAACLRKIRFSRIPFTPHVEDAGLLHNALGSIPK